MVVHVQQDPKLAFPAYQIKAKTKAELRRYVAEHGLAWLKLQKQRGASGGIMVDIDHTLLNGSEAVAHGFEFMKEMYEEACKLFPVHVVTARPDYDHKHCIGMLHKRGFAVPPDRLHMLPGDLYGSSTTHVERFKWAAFAKISKQHNGVIARFGDKLWDVAHLESLDTTLKHISDRDCYVFLDPALKGTYSAKLPGE